MSILIFIVISCDDFVEVDLPKNQLTSQDVFEDLATATAAQMDIYGKLRDGGFVSGTGLNVQMGLYTDELVSNMGNVFFDHTLTAINVPEHWWRHAYNVIYASNAILEGVQNSTTITMQDKNQLLGESLFVRAYLHTLLVELWGPIPYVNTKDYTINTSKSRMPVDDVYAHIVNDLLEAINLLEGDISEDPHDGQVRRIRPYKEVAEALLARVYLYTEQWKLAEETTSNVINSFVLETDLTKVYLNKASGTIWQFKPSSKGGNTSEGSIFIFTDFPGSKPILSESVIQAFESDDLRKSTWTKAVSNGTSTWYHANKYKESTVTEPESLEYSIVFRLAEQYLIRAEARAQLGKISGAQEDLNAIRNRAGLPNTTAISTETLLDAILHERRVELFTEHGHRWFDLKRTGKAAEVLAPIKPNWKNSHVLLPIPESEIELNPNLLPQNEGY